MPNSEEPDKRETVEESDRKGDDLNIQPVYSDVANVILRQEEIILMFGLMQELSPGEGVVQLSNSITLNPYSAKRLTLHLRNAINEYETKFGSINLPDSPLHGPHHEKYTAPGVRETDEGREKAAVIPSLLKALGVPVDAERSFKLIKNNLITNRYLIGFSKKTLGKDALEKIKSVCKRMNMDENFFRTFEQCFPDGDYVHFGFEENESACVNKVYLEFYEKIEKERKDQPANKDPALLHLGFKWDSSDSSRRVISRYTWLPLLSVSEMNERVAGIISSSEDDQVIKAVTGILAVAERRIDSSEILYQEVTEEGNPRKSFDINIYRSGLKVSELYAFLLELSIHYGIPRDMFHEYYGPIRDKVFGHISGGINREGRSFVTVYYGVEGVKNPEEIILISDEKDKIRKIETGENITGVEEIDSNAELMYNLVNQLDVQVGFERSFKLVKDRLLADRFLMGFKREYLSPGQDDDVLAICRRLNMPDDFQKSFASNMSDASVILFGFEGNEETVLYKAYLEFGGRIESLVNIDPAKPPPIQIDFGYKWDVFENSKKITTEYTCFPSLDYAGMLKRIKNIFPDSKQKRIFDVTAGIINMARCRISTDEFLFIEAKDENNPRLSFDINMYTADLRMWELYPFLLKTIDCYSIPGEKFHDLYSGISSDIFGHVTGGIDREGRDFLTFYFGKKGSSGRVAGIY